MAPADATKDNDSVIEIDPRPIKALKGTKPAAATKASKASAKASNIPRPSDVAAAKADTKRVLDDADDDDADTTEVNAAAAEEAEADLALEVKPKRGRTSKRAKIAAVEPAKDAGWVDLDVGDEDDPLMVTAYVNEVYEYLKEIEVCCFLSYDSV